MLMIVKSWPEWQKTDWNASCHIFITLEDEKVDKGKREFQQEMPGTPEV